MGRTCVVPGCKSGYKNVDMRGVSMFTFREEWRGKISRANGWKFTANNGICSKHFVEEDIVREATTANSRGRRKKKGDSLLKSYVKSDAYPTIFPGCPSHLTKKRASRRKSNTSASERIAAANKRNEERKQKELEADTISTIEEISSQFKNKILDKTKLESSPSIVVTDHEVVIYKIHVINGDLKPAVKYSVTIDSNFSFQCYLNDKRIPYTHFASIGISNGKIKLFSQISHILDVLDSSVIETKSDNDLLLSHIEGLKQFETTNEKLRSKLNFLIEQLELACMHIQHRRYSPALLSMCVLWENASSNLYQQIREENVLTLPSVRYIKKLNSALDVETGLTPQTIKYLEARISKMTKLDKIGSMMMDEVYASKRSEYTRSNGRIYGMVDNDLTKTLLVLMFKSVATSYEDVIAMVPTSKIDSGKIHALFLKCLSSITPLGYNVVASLVDGHSSNVKFYRTELCDGELKPHIPHPLVEGRKIFLPFDSTHIFKCIYNNFEGRKTFSCPGFDGGEPFIANFQHIKELYNLEFTKPVKMAFELNHQCLHPQPIEKTKVSLASKVFSESTRNAMRYYVENGHPQWKGTLAFLDLLAKWWNVLNVRSRFKGQQKRNPDCEPITADNYEKIKLLFSTIVSWIDEWESSGKSGLSNETFKTFRQNSASIPLLAEYLIFEMGLEFILTGKIQSDFLEKRFGRYRQLSGADYFITERQFLEAEKSIRVKSLIKFSGYSIKDVQNIMSRDDSSEIDSFLADTIMDFVSEDTVTEMTAADKSIIYYVAGFVSKSTMKHNKCTECENVLGSKNEEIVILIDDSLPPESKEFLNSINRGGLIKPSDILYTACTGAWEIYTLIMDNAESKTEFLASKNHRAIFHVCYITYLKSRNKFDELFSFKCMNDHLFETFLKKISEKFFNVMAKNFVSETNSVTHSLKKRKSTAKDDKRSLTRSQAKARKLTSQN